MAEKEKDVQLNCAVLTFVDLAGAEREKRTGNQVICGSCETFN